MNEVNDASPASEASGVERLVMLQNSQLESRLDKWDRFRAEMENHRDRLAKLAVSFLELDAFDDAAKCAIRAEGINYVIGRMPPIET
jgi:hypothetical protein